MRTINQKNLKEASKNVRMMGTSIDLIVTHQYPEWILNQITLRLKMYEHRFSANDPHSEVNEVNANAGIQEVPVHPELYELIKLGKQHSLAPNSHLNIAIGPLIQTWRIGFDNAKVPTDEEVQKLLTITNPNEILLNDAEKSVFLAQKGMKVDLGALAKGYIADRIIDYLAEENVKSALINLGGNLVTYGPALKRSDRYWRIGIQNPLLAHDDSQIILKLQNKSVVTSGIYERKLEYKGETFHHIFDPNTGYPVETSLASLTIISDESVDGEIWTTRLFGQTPSQIINTINEMKTIDGLVITKDGDVIYSEGMKVFL